MLSKEKQDDIRLKGRTIKGYFNRVNLSVSAAIQMLNHAHFGLPHQVMGLLQGYCSVDEQIDRGVRVEHGVFNVTDVIALPVESSETRVTADEETNGLMAIYSEWIAKIGAYNILGWYHSHPNFGCWLSGIDVDTTSIHQLINDPFVALVVDPIKSINFQKLDIGAFRVYSQKSHEEKSFKKQDLPRKKVVDFGYHCHRYYQLPIDLVVESKNKKALANLQKFQWSSELANSNFFSQLSYLTDAVYQEKEDIAQYFTLMENKPTLQEVKDKKRSTIKKVSQYAQERNLSLIDSGIKTLLF